MHTLFSQDDGSQNRIITKTIHQLFEDQATVTPNNVALIFGNHTLTYRELNEKSNQLAHYLKEYYQKILKKNLVLETLIGIYFERSIEMIVAILAILKTGGTYVPIDPSYPQERINYIAEDTQIKLILTHQNLLQKAKKCKPIKLLPIDDLPDLVKQPITNLLPHVMPNNLAYVIFTSGSTGNPKGVLIQHDGVVNCILSIRDKINLNNSDKFLAITALVFDVSVLDYFMPFSAGAQTVIANKDTRQDGKQLVRLLSEKGITAMQATPALWDILVNFNWNLENNDFKILTAGEALPAPLAQKLIKRGKLFNIYGPTEATIYSTFTELKAGDPITIGKPIANMNAYILDSLLQPVPEGIIGELYLSGIGLARGYLNRPELNKEKFIDNPFVKNSIFTKLYKTGDLVRILSDGNIEFIGRIDNQVKIRGYRIELGEIETKLLSHPEIKQCAVLAVAPNEKELLDRTIVAFCVVNKNVSPVVLRSYLKLILPDYMIPTHFIFIDKFHVNSNGKIDRESLTLYKLEYQTSDSIALPKNDSEKLLAKIWGDILHLDKISTEDNFFELGGNSLKAIKVLTRIHEVFGIELTTNVLFKFNTIKDLSEYLTKQKSCSSEIIYKPKLAAIERKEQIPLSYEQQRLWFLDQYQAHNSQHYHVPLAFRLIGHINHKNLQKAINHIVKRHEILRTVFKQDKSGNPYQCILEPIDNLIILEQKMIDDGDINNILSLEALRPFNLSKEPLIRFTLFKIKNDANHIFFINQHHIITDDWSIDIFLEELSKAYNDLCLEKEIHLPYLEIQYADYAYWQRRELQNEFIEEQLNYWRKKLANIQVLQLTTDKPRPIIQTYQGSRIVFNFDDKLAKGLNQLAITHGCTLYMVLISGFYILLNRYSNQPDIIIGTPIASRHHKQLENLIGFFTNTIALRENLANKRVDELLSDIKQICIEGHQYQKIPFDRLVEALNLPRDQSRSPIFQVMFAMQNLMDHSGLNFCGVEISSIKVNHHVSKFDLTLSIQESKEGLEGEFEYNTDLYNESTIIRMCQHYKNILIAMVNYQGKNVDELPMLTQEEYQTVITDWNKTEATYPLDKTIHQLFEEQARITPNNIALEFEDNILTYQELNEKANQVAHYLRDYYRSTLKQELMADTLIGICFERSLEMIIAILAILKSGGAYVPLEPDYPTERIRYIISDTQVLLILSHQAAYPRISSAEHNLCPAKILTIDSIPVIANYPIANLSDNTTPHSLAYVLYTSGSTGNPKGVLIQHNGVVNCIFSIREKINLHSTDTFLAIIALVFDVSVLDYFLPFSVGAKIVIVDSQTRKDGKQLAKLFSEKNVTIMQATPGLWEILAAFDWKLNYAFKILTAGEPLSASLANKLIKRGRVFNIYGPTEATIYATFTEIKFNDKITIGKPINNTKAYILDRFMQPVAIGVVGELYLAGINIARGYLNLPELSREKFVDNPFKTNPSTAKLYKTGDLARWMPDGNIEFLGRKDNQVKIRGYRIELGEIEAKLSSHPAINQCVVIINETANNKYIYAYYTLKTPTQSVELKKYLIAHVPEYMFPTFFVEIDNMPLNTNGKIDIEKIKKSFLPKPINICNKNDELTNIQKSVLKVWQEVLEHTDINVEDNFFDIGGNSLSLVKLKVRLEQELNLENIKIVDLFKYPTIKNFTESLILSEIKLPEGIKTNTTSTNNEIAIIALSGEFSGSNNPEEYWNNILNGRECINFIPLDQCKKNGVPESKIRNKNYVNGSGELTDLEQFDYSFWRMSQKDASMLDPQIRKFLLHCWISLEKTGYINQRNELSIGVFAGASSSQYFHNRILNNESFVNELNLWEATTMNEPNFLTTRVSYLLGLTGPALNINTACSTSLVAVAEACEKLQLNKCDIALAGGVSINLPEEHGHMYVPGMIFSPDGHCRPFDQNAQGTNIGSGVGVVVLKRLKDAQRDNDTILGVIKGYSVNNDGNRKVGYTAPSVIGQSECILKAYEMAGIEPNSLDYIECHSTATSLGDQIELTALCDVFNRFATKEPTTKCAIGSVKANIGHTDAAAGIAGLIKVCMMLEHKKIPPQINFDSLHPDLKFADRFFLIHKEACDWNSSIHPRRAAVSAFGIGGTNAHLVLEEYVEIGNEPIKVSHSSLPAYQFNNERCWIDLDDHQFRKNNSPILVNKSLYYKLNWQRTHLKHTHITSQKKTWIIFENENGLGKSIGKQIEAYDHTVIYVTTDLTIDCCDLIEERHIKLNPSHTEAFSEVTKFLELSDKSPDYFLFYWSYRDEGKAINPSTINELQYYGFQSIFHLNQQLLRFITKKAVIITHSFYMFDIIGTEKINVSMSPILGLGKVITQENPYVKFMHLDLDYQNDNPTLLNVINNFSDESDTAFKICALRHNKLWVQKYENIVLETPTIRQSAFKDHGVYLITGGLGGLGFALARFVAKNFSCNLILVSRRNINNEKSENIQDKLNEIGNFRAKIHFYQCDISNSEMVEKLFTFLKDKFGYLNGIIHTAGVPSANIKHQEDIFAAQKILSPKVTGTLNLVHYSRLFDLNFLLLCSSLTSIVGAIGNGAYSAANSFLDVFSQIKIPHIQNIITINWNQISDVGMAADFIKLYSGTISENSINSSKAIEIIDNVLQTNINQLIISTECVEDILRVSSPVTTAAIPNPIDSVQLKENANDHELRIAKIFADVLGLKTFSKNDSFFDLGGHSLNVIQVVLKINSLFTARCTLTDVFNNDTVSKLARFIEMNNQTSNEFDYVAPRSITEEQISRIFSHVLNKTRIGVEDNFFALGGNNLLAEELLAKINTAFSQNLSLNELLSNPSPFGITKLINVAYIHERSNPLILINNQPNTVPLILIHPISGLSFCYLPLKEFLPNQKIIGICNPKFGNMRNPYQSIEEMASAYVNIIRKFFPNESTFCLGGWSAGGLIAYEMAQQMKAAGIQIESIIMFDSHSAETFVDQTLTDDEMKNDLIEEGIDPTTSEGRAIEIEIWNTWNLIKSYKTSNYDGRVILLKAQQSPRPKSVDDLCNGWYSFLTLPLQIHTVNGSHGKIFFYRNINQWGHILRNLVESKGIDPILLNNQLNYLNRQLLYAIKYNDNILSEWCLRLGAVTHDNIESYEFV